MRFNNSKNANSATFYVAPKPPPPRAGHPTNARSHDACRICVHLSLTDAATSHSGCHHLHTSPTRRLHDNSCVHIMVLCRVGLLWRSLPSVTLSPQCGLADISARRQRRRVIRQAGAHPLPLHRNSIAGAGASELHLPKQIYLGQIVNFAGTGPQRAGPRRVWGMVGWRMGVASGWPIFAQGGIVTVGWGGSCCQQVVNFGMHLWNTCSAGGREGAYLLCVVSSANKDIRWLSYIPFTFNVE